MGGRQSDLHPVHIFLLGFGGVLGKHKGAAQHTARQQQRRKGRQ